MSESWMIGLLGTVAGLCTTGSFLPQVIKAWRERDTAAISTRMYVIISGAFVLWLCYGLAIGSWPIVTFNLLNLGLSAAILFLKFRQPGGRDRPTVSAQDHEGGDFARTHETTTASQEGTVVLRSDLLRVQATKADMPSTGASVPASSYQC